MPDEFKTDVADAGSHLIHGWRECSSEAESRDWLRMHMVADRAVFLAARRGEAEARLRVELIKDAVRTATTSREGA